MHIKKTLFYFWGVATIVFLLVAMVSYSKKDTGLTSLPDATQMTVAYGHVEHIALGKETYGGPHNVRIDIALDNLGVARFFGRDINLAVPRFRALKSGDRVQIKYETQTPLPVPPARFGARIIELRSADQLVWSQADSATIAARLRQGYIETAFYCFTAAFCTLVIAILSYRRMK